MSEITRDPDTEETIEATISLDLFPVLTDRIRDVESRRSEAEERLQGKSSG